LRGNDWINLDYPHADEVRAIQNKINEIQNLATSQTSISSIISDKETFQSDLKEIRRLINEDLTPKLEEMPSVEATKKILKSTAAKSKAENRSDLSKEGSPSLTKLKSDLKEYFENVTKQIRIKLKERDSVVESNAKKAILMWIKFLLRMRIRLWNCNRKPMSRFLVFQLVK
jgi:hypothetical protein